MLKMVRRKIPWILVFEAAMALRARWSTWLARKSKGNPMALTREERRDFRRIAAGIDAFGLARDLAPFGRRLRGGRH
jgi:hypothetical protein